MKSIGFSEMVNVVRRFGFVRQHWNYWRKADHFIFQWHYPRFTKVICIICLLAIYLFRADHLLSYIIGAIIARALCNSDEAIVFTNKVE